MKVTNKEINKLTIAVMHDMATNNPFFAELFKHCKPYETIPKITKFMEQENAKD